MKQFTLLLGAFALTATLSAQRTHRPATLRPAATHVLGAKGSAATAATAKPMRPAAMAERLRAMKAPRRLAEAQDAVTVLYRPGHETSYAWNADNSDWDKAADLHYTYDGLGRIASYQAEYATYKERVSYEYNADGLITRQLVERDEDGAGWVNYAQITSKYDPVVKDLVIECLDMSWDGTQWQNNDETSYRRVITRNEAGIVLTVSYEIWYEGEWTEYSLTTNTVADDVVTATAVAFATDFEADGTPVYEPYTKAINLTWERTDGQIVTDYLLDLTTGNNRLASGLLLDEDGDGQISATYSGEKDYELVIDYPASDYYAPSREMYSHVSIDDKGSYQEISRIYSDDNEDGEYSDEEYYPEETYIVCELLDNNKNQVALYSQMGDDAYGFYYYEMYKGTRYTYDENETATETVQFTKEPEYDGDYNITGWTDVNVLRIVADDIQRIEVDPTGISAVPTAPAAEADGALYDLSGRKLTSAPTRGIYITSAGRKVYVK